MVRLELYKKILKYILTNYSGLASTSEDYKDVRDYISSDDVVNAATLLKAQTTLSACLHPILLSIINAEPAELSVNVVSNFRKIVLFEKWGNDKKYERNFCYCSPSLFVLDADYLYHQENDEEYLQQLWLYLEKLCLKPADLKVLIKSIVNKKHNTYVLAYDKISLGYIANAKVSQEELCSYAYSASLHEKKQIEYHQDLKYDVNAIALNAFNYNKDVTYQQYYDIYDVINDWLHSEDILTAFLRIYQIVEFLIYRQQMSEIIRVSTIKQSFLREVKNLNKRFETGERATIVENIPIVFGTLTATTANINAAEPFIKKYYGKNKTGTHAYLFSTLHANEKSIALAKFIYDTRCSIVHNKEAEFHISYNNYEEYKSVLPLLKEVHDQLANKIWTLMNTPGVCISYENERYIDLF